MKVAIVGCGAMGSVYAGLLAGAGNEVMVVDRWQAHVDAIRTQGLRVEGASGDLVVQLQAYTQAPVQAMDLVIIAAKAVQVGDAAHETKKLLGPQTVVLTIQNGLGSADTVAEIVGKERLVVGIAAAFGASLRGPGHAHHNSMNAVKMGAYAGLAAARVEEVAALWRGAGFTADAVDNVAAMQWEKLICNVAFSAPCALTGLTVGQAMDDPDMGPTGLAAAVEAWKIALARKVPISVTDPEAHVRAFGERVRNARPSVLLDHDVRRPSEIDVINGAVPREAAKCGQFAPVNATLTALVRQRERNF
ncbi:MULTISPECIES: ketopantoate reductase family protein [Polaromonas]|uniref:2-dehydropantoate 2-reductase n=1 Tax=Polaromonas aquatica TaxID=332657 RepID=A0ABW1TWS0_9BURK